jgi:hypothetical protein
MLVFQSGVDQEINPVMNQKVNSKVSSTDIANLGE